MLTDMQLRTIWGRGGEVLGGQGMCPVVEFWKARSGASWQSEGGGGTSSTRPGVLGDCCA